MFLFLQTWRDLGYLDWEEEEWKGDIWGLCWMILVDDGGNGRGLTHGMLIDSFPANLCSLTVFS